MFALLCLKHVTGLDLKGHIMSYNVFASKSYRLNITDLSRKIGNRHDITITGTKPNLLVKLFSGNTFCILYILHCFFIMDQYNLYTGRYFNAVTQSAYSQCMVGVLMDVTWTGFLKNRM